MGCNCLNVFRLLAEPILHLCNFPVFPSNQTSLNKITYDRVINFKGLEKEVIILVDIDKSMDIEEDIYVGLTRAKAELIIISGKRCIERLKTLSI